MNARSSFDSAPTTATGSGSVRFGMAVLLVALAMRLYLVIQGGAYFWTDEKRYNASRAAVAALVDHDPPAAWHHLASTSDHIGFRWLALVPASVERILYSDDPPHARICAGFFALFSVANLFLVWRIARRLSADEWEAGLALAFAASSNTLFYYARHCFPYDAALTFFLGAALLSIGPERRYSPLCVGLCCGLGYLTYNGYWSVGAVVLLLDVLWRGDCRPARIRRALLGLAGLLAPIVVVFGLARLSGYDLAGDSLAFAGTVNQGDFGDGWRFAPEYLWAADGALALGLVAFAIAGVIVALVQRQSQPWFRWLMAVGSLFGIWIFCSDLIHQFVLYGRIVRAAVPFLALAAAGAVGLLWRSSGIVFRHVLRGGAIALCLAGAAMMLQPLRQKFPVEFRARAQRVATDALRRDPHAVFQTLYANYLYSPAFPAEPRSRRELLREPHPQHYLPYLYDGYPRAQRPLYLGHDTAMRLVQLDTDRGLHLLKLSPGSQWLAPFPGPLLIRLRLPTDRVGRSESLLLHGEDRAQQDLLAIDYADPSHVRLGVRHGESATRWSDLLACDYQAEHFVTVSFGSFYPLAGDGRFAHAPGLDELQKRLVVRLDGETALAGESPSTPAPGAALQLGAGLRSIDGLFPVFSGEMRSVRQIDPRTSLDAEWLAPAPSDRFFHEYPGPLELTLRFPEERAGRSQALVSTGVTGAGDLFYVSFLDDRHVRFGLEHWGEPPLRSPPVEIEPHAVQRLTVSMGSLFPPAASAEYDRSPGLRFWRDLLLARLNGRTVFSATTSFHAAEPRSLKVGVCETGANGAEATFEGEILQWRPAAPHELGAERGGIAAVRGPFFGDHHGPVELLLRFPGGGPNRAEVLLASGTFGAGDQFYVSYLDDRHVRFGLDHWGDPPLLSSVFEIAPGAVHRLVVSLGSLFPPPQDSRYTGAAQVRFLRQWLFASLDGQKIFSQAFSFHASEPDAVSFGRSLIGGSNAAPVFTGDLLEIHHRTPESLGLVEQELTWPPSSGERLPGGYAGAVELDVVLPERWNPGLEPLLVTGEGPASDIVVIKYRGTKEVQLGYRHGNGAIAWSTPTPTAPGRTHTVAISIGSLFPAAGSPWLAAHPDRPRLEGRTFLAVDGHAVLSQAGESFAAAPGDVFLGASHGDLKWLRAHFAGKILAVHRVDLARNF